MACRITGKTEETNSRLSFQERPPKPHCRPGPPSQLQSEITTNDTFAMIMKLLCHQPQSHCMLDTIQADRVPTSCLSTPTEQLDP